MAFRFMKPKTRIVPIKKSEEDQEVLDKLQEYLDSALEEPVRFLVRFWKDQAAVLTYKELRKIAVSEEFPEEIMKDWRQDYSRLLRDKMTPVWEEAVKAGIQSNPVLQGMRFDTRELVGDWITEHTAEMVTRVTDDQVKAIRYIVGESVTYKMGADETARYIRPIVGLTEQQTAANIKYYNNIKAQMAADHPRMKPGSIEQKARDAAAKYASKQHRTRADTIARTEIITAYHEGNDRGVRECIYDGRLPKMKKVWSTSLDAKVCSACQALEGVELDMDKEFSAKSWRKTVTTSIPPLHPRCACAVKYVESSEKDGIMVSGARITDVFSKEAEQFAEMYYEEIRSFSTDVKKIARNLEKNESDILKIKKYLFEDKSWFDSDTGKWRRFDPDCAIAQSWQRLMIGKDIKPHDRTLIEHELLEMKIKQKNPNMEHWKAHELAAKKFDYPKEALEYYGNLKKYKKDK